ncbi:Leucine-, isoleucine-, valine-, threonine-, and alanine-binding protein [Thermoflexales bacterium]|nr:Leucine-, isoleucine-, valine-, threonine-, and alanine-binding protein [Thermoflexales bacterium]
MGKSVSRWMLVVAVLAALLLPACQSGGQSIVRVYVSLPLQSPSPNTTGMGKSIQRGIERAFEEVGHQVKSMDGRSVQILLAVKDDGNAVGQWEREKEEKNAREAAADPQAVAYLGPYNSGAAMVSIPILNRAGVLQISPSATWPGLTKPGFAQGEPGIFYPTGKRTFFRVVPTDEKQGPAAALWARSLGLRTFYILDDGEAYGVGVASLFSNYAQQIGMFQVGRQTIDKTATDYRTVLEAVKEFDPDLIYFGGTVANGAPRLLQQLREMGIEAAVMGADALVDQSLIEMAGAAADGVYATFIGVPPDRLTTDEGKKFYADYKALHGEEPGAFSQYGYDAGRAIIAAIGQARTVDREGVLAGLQTVSSLKGTTGTYVFDRAGDTSLGSVSAMVVENGAFKFVERLNVPQQ